MNNKTFLVTGAAALTSAMTFINPANAANIQIGASGKTYTSSAVACIANPATGTLSPAAEAGLYNPPTKTRGAILLNGVLVANVTTTRPATTVWLNDGINNVAVALSKKIIDRYTFAVQPGMCDLPDTSGNTFSADGLLEYAASGKSYATVTPGCAMNGRTGQVQPYVNLFDNGTYLLNVSINGVPLTQMSATHPHTPVFLSAGQNVISAANGFVSVDYYVRDGGDGTCVML